MALALTSTLLAFAPKNARFDLLTAVSISITMAAAGSTAIIYLERKRIGYKWFVQNLAVEKNDEFMHFLQIDKILPAQNYILVQSNEKLIGHAYARITDVPYLIDDLDRDRKLFFVGNFARILSTLNFTFEIIPRIMPISTEAFLKNIHKQIEDLRMTISAEGANANPAREARLAHLEKLSASLLSGEGARDVGFLAHIMVEGSNEQEIANQLDSNMKTMISALESGLGVRAERLNGYKMLEAIQEFFRASGIAQATNPCRMLSWDIAYLIPFTRPKLPPAEKLLGGVYLGRTSTGAIVCLDLKKYANPHIAVLGKSGFGKSTTVKTFISRMFDLTGTPILIIDYAGEYLEWVKSRKGVVVDMRKDRINPFELGHAMLIDRIRQVVDAFTKTCDFKTINQRNAFAEYVTKVYATKGFKLDDPKTWNTQPPTLGDLIELMEKELPRLPMLKQLTIQSLLSRLQVLASGPFGVFGHSTVSITQLTQSLTCIDLSKIASNTLKDLIAWTVLQYLDAMMRLEGIKEEVRLVVVLDEAWKLCQDTDSLPVAIIKEGRKYGYSLIVSTQDIIDVAEPILSNAGTVVIHRTEHPRYLNFFKRAYDLTDLEISKIKNLPIGEALIKISTDSKPFITKIDMEQVEPSEKRGIIQQSKNGFSSVQTGKNLSPNSKAEKTLRCSTEDSHRLSEDEERMLKVISENAVYSVNECYERAGLTQFRGNRAKELLLAKRLIRVLSLPKIGKGRKPETFELIEEGRNLVERLGYKIQPTAGREGGIIHRYLTNLVGQEFQSHGCKVEIERSLGDGKTVDLLVDSSLAVEVETGESDMVSNVRKNLERGFDVLIVVADNSFYQVMKKIEDAKMEEKVRILTVSKIPEFIGKLKTPDENIRKENTKSS